MPKKKIFTYVTHPSINARNHVIQGENLDILRSLPDGCADLIYIDPPFNTGKAMERKVVKAARSEKGTGKVGFHGSSYTHVSQSLSSFQDRYDDFLGFLEPRLREAHRLLSDKGSLYFHIDYREVHYCKILLDTIFSRKCFLNEIIWSYDYGARSKSRWPTKHDNILLYVKNAKTYHFNTDEVERLPYMAPSLVTKEKAARGKLPTDSWWHTIVPTNSREKTGYATQKPMGIMKRIVAASSRKGDLVIDFFAGSGSTGAAAALLGRRFLLIDNSTEAIAVMRKRFKDRDDVDFTVAGEPLPESVDQGASEHVDAVSRTARKTAVSDS